MIRTVTILQDSKDDELVVYFGEQLVDETKVVVYKELDFGVAQAIEDFLATGEVSEYTN